MKYKNLDGYSYLQYIKRSVTMPFKITKIYKEVAEEFNTTPGAVERCIRYFIRKNGSDKTNSEYVADMLTEEEDINNQIERLESMLEDLKNYKEHSRPLTTYEEIGMKESDF